VARALRPSGIGALAAGLDFVLRERAIQPAGLPDPAHALASPDGLCGLVAEPRAEMVMEGLARGLFPAADCGPLKWWAPAHRQVLRPASCRLPSGARRLLRSDTLVFDIDADFDMTIAAHARARGGWRSGHLFSPRGLSLLAGLADLGYAHAIDVEDALGRRVAGAFGVAVGQAFVTLGVFGETADLADVALVVLNRHLKEKGFLLHDFVGDGDVSHLGFAPMERDAYQRALAGLADLGRAERWKVDRALCGRGSPATLGEKLPEPVRDHVDADVAPRAIAA
jgi:leucyl/phenylalanyl-tRNA--protein transferase